MGFEDSDGDTEGSGTPAEQAPLASEVLQRTWEPRPWPVH